MPKTTITKPTIKLDFTDFGGINKENNWLSRILQKHFRIVISDKPDLLIFQEGGHLNRLYNCRKLFISGESNLPDWSRTDYALTCHYLNDPRQLRYPYYVWGSEATANDLVKSEEETTRILKQKKKFCSALISNCNPRRTKKRIEFFKKLHARKKLESGGRYMNNIGGQLPIANGVKLAFYKPCKFHFCYENKEVDGYTTEKIVDAMFARCVPIYWGNPRINEEFNTKSMLCRYDYPDDETFIDEIIEVDCNNDLYQKIVEQPYFNQNTPNEFFSETRLINFINTILDDRSKPVSQKRRFWQFGRFRLAKCMKS
jgi:hypothetical protein